MSKGVEWALHCCVNLSWLGPDRAAPIARLAALYDLPAPYLNKQMQALVRSGIVSSVSGPRGGFQLARQPAAITLMDVVTAIEGPEPAFRCTEIRQQGPWGADPESFRLPCLIDQAMRRADLAWRAELAAQSLEDIRRDVRRSVPDLPDRTRRWFADAGC